MSIPEEPGRRDEPIPQPPKKGDAYPDSLIEILARIMEELEASKAKKATGKEPDRGKTSCWDDSQNIYLEMNFGDSNGSGFDLCFTHGRVFIRLDR